MLEVMTAGSADLSRADSAMILNCWEKSSTPLIKELEQTVSFAERKCGDLMQQLHFYKEYYEKWVHSERLNHNTCPKKKIKKLNKPEMGGSSSENEFEKVNRYFYKKIRNKISEMNQEITQANRKLHDKHELQRSLNAIKPEPQPSSVESFQSDVPEFKGIENKACKSEPVVTVLQQNETTSADLSAQDNRDDIKVTEKQSSKSVPMRNIDTRSRDQTPIRKRFSNLQRYKLRSKSLPQGVRRKFGFGGFIEVFDPKANLRNSRSKSRTSVKVETYRSFKTFKSDGQMKGKKIDSKNSLYVKTRRNQPISARSLQYRAPKMRSDEKKPNESNGNYFSKDVRPQSAIPNKVIDKFHQTRETVSQSTFVGKAPSNNTCKDIVPTNTALKGAGDSNMGALNHFISKPNTLIPFLRQPIPFIPCSSTSKTFNLGLNVQQVLSMIKHRRHSMTLQSVIKNGMQATRSITDNIEPTVNTLFFSHTTSHSQVTSALCPARSCIEDTFSIVTDDIACRSKCTLLKEAQALRAEAILDKKTDNSRNEMKLNEVTKLERPEDVWVVEQPDETSRDYKKPKTRCTCFPSKHCVEYQKVLREYTGWRMPTNKNVPYPSDGYSTYQPMITYQKSKLCSIPSQEDVNWALNENDSKIELMKVQHHLINLNRRYSSLEEQIAQRNLDDYEANAELDAMESELSLREMEFKDIINFYQQLIQLKDKLKTLRVKSVSSTSQTAVHQVQRPKKDPLRPTPSMALTKVLRKIQGLQDKIKLIDAP